MKNIVFDLGGVLIDWNPRFLYRKLFQKESEMEYFLGHICTQEWNEQQDGGRSFAEGEAELIAKHPEFEAFISAYHFRWPEMLNGPIAGTVKILAKLAEQKKVRLLALTNWSAETFPYAEKNFEFLKTFDTIVVSGRIKLKKPDPAIFHHLIEVGKIKAQETLFIDDNQQNIQTAQAMSFHAEHFKSSELLEKRLRNLGVLTF